MFTTADVDNLDHLKTCNLSNASFNGSMLSFTNHISVENEGMPRDPITIDPNDKSKPSLPEYYIRVPPCELPTGDVFVPKTDYGNVRPTLNRRGGAIIRDQVWIDNVWNALVKDILGEDEKVMWSGHFSQLQDKSAVKPAAITGMCPIFPDKVTDPALLKHVMKLTKDGIEFLNPGQTPVLGVDQQPYLTMKQIQWVYPEELGGDKMVLML